MSEQPADSKIKAAMDSTILRVVQGVLSMVVVPLLLLGMNRVLDGQEKVSVAVQSLVVQHAADAVHLEAAEKSALANAAELAALRDAHAALVSRYTELEYRVRELEGRRH